MEPINYLAQVADPFAASLKGYAATDAILNAEAKRAEALRQQQLQQQQQQQLAQEQARFFANPNPTMRDAARYASLLTPEQSKAFQPFMEGISKEQQQNTLKRAGQHASALIFNPELAIKRLEQDSLAAKNSGDEDDAQFFERLAKAAADPTQGPATAFKALVQSSAYIPGAKEMFETIDKGMSTAREETMAPVKLREQVAKAGEAESSAQKAAVAAKFAESNAALDLQKKGWDITKIQEDINIAKQNSKIAAMNAQIAREGNAIKREENQLKLRDMIDKRDTAVREKVADVESARFNIDNMLNTADRILKNPSLNSVVGTVQGRMPVLLSDEAQDAVALIETLGSQAFLSQIPNVKGMGALSNAEGEKLQNAFQNLGRVQSEKQFRENLSEAQRLLLKARQNVAKRNGLPDSVPDTPAVQTAPADIDALVKKYGG